MPPPADAELAAPVRETQDKKDYVVEEYDTSPVPASKTLLQREAFIKLESFILFGFTLQATWEGVALTMQFALLNGGPASLTSGAFLTGIGSTAIGISLAELASIDPAIGAQYRWSNRFAPRWNRFFGLLQGWLTLLAWLTAVTASPAYLANGTLSLVELWHPNWVPAAWMTTLVMWIYLIIPVVMNLWFRKLIKPLELVGAVSHALFPIIIMIWLLVAGPRSTNDQVWTNITYGKDVSGWTSPFLAFGIGLVPSAFSSAGIDGILHISKEVKEPHKNSPIAMVSALTTNWIVGAVFMIAVCYRLGDPTVVAAAPGGTSIIAVLMQATHSKVATTIFITAMEFNLFVSLFNIFASVARLTWSFSQDKGLPFSSILIPVSQRFKIPLNALLFVTLFSMVLSCINFGSSVAFNALIALPTVGYYISYFPPILFICWQKFLGYDIPYRSFRLGRWPGFALNLFSLVYIVYITIMVSLPTIRPVTSVNMNYGAPIALAIIVLAIGDWCISGRTRYHISRAADVDEDIPSAGDTDRSAHRG